MSVPTSPDSPDRLELVSAARALSRHGLVTAYGHVSMRDGDDIVMTPPIALGDTDASSLLTVPLDAVELPAGTPPEAWAHLAIYRARPEVSAVARAMPPSAFAASATTTVVPVLHGQTAWLGSEIPVHPSSTLLRSAELAAAMANTLGQQHAVILKGNGALTVGDRPGTAVARMQLLEVACRTWLQAAAVGAPQPLSTEEIAGWQATTGQLLPRLWEFLRTDG